MKNTINEEQHEATAAQNRLLKELERLGFVEGTKPKGKWLWRLTSKGEDAADTMFGIRVLARLDDKGFEKIFDVEDYGKVGSSFIWGEED